MRNKYCDYYYTTRKNQDGEFKYYIRNKEGEILEISEGAYSSKGEAEEAAREAISYHYV
jgi:uncharacterized protein YegP (UPF0339 family)